jgi:hypothetical protein
MIRLYSCSSLFVIFLIFSQALRHHEAGIREVIKLFGEEAGFVAKQHIISDLKEEGWKNSDPFPRDEDHYVKMGLF